MSDLDVVTSFYHKLFANYDLEQIEFIYKDPRSGEEKRWAGYFTHIPKLVDLKKALAKHQRLQNMAGHGRIGSLGCNINMARGFVDLSYLHALFIMLDPWGATARYLSISAKNHLAYNIKPRLHDPYKRKLILKDVDKNTFHVFFNDWNFNYSVSVDLRDIASKKSLGKLIYLQSAKPYDPLMLIAKTKGSSNHIIAELFNFKRRDWETHTFFGPATFSAQESSDQDGYQNLTFFYQTKTN